MDKLKGFIKTYETWVAANPETVCDVETTTKWVSYFIAGRISDSNVVSELVYSLSNMLVLYNDRIIDRARTNAKDATAAVLHSNTKNKNAGFCYRLKVMLTTLEYCEVFIEISAKRLFGTKGKWLFITLMQVAKAAGRFFILKNSTEQIITSPAMPSLNRRALIKKDKEAAASAVGGAVPKNGTVQQTIENSFTFQLKRSGRVVRKVEGAPPLQFRDFKIGSGSSSTDGNRLMPSALVNAEYLYIAKPLIHLAAMGIFGEKTWKQYAVALIIDLVSIRLYHQNRHLMSKEQKLELSRRCMNLSLYLMRSPFFDRVTQTRLERMLNFVAQNIPLLKMVAGPLKEYIPYWQNTYYYLWST